MIEEPLDNYEVNTPERIGFGPRLGAMLLDSLFLFTIIPLLSWIFLRFGIGELLIQRGFDALSANEELIEMLEEQMGAYYDLYLSAVGLASTIAILYNLIEGFTGASPGKMILGLQIAHEDGRKGEFNLFMSRWFFKNLSSVLSFLYLMVTVAILATLSSILSTVIFIGCFLALSERKMALHDMIAKTAVFKKTSISQD